ncbi:B3 domain-containing protein Os05g0481400 [Castanea sativa]|uniref:B3 domain-containing protein Os05g0481400 n=1 Tax=Castanea sativa TaxID=21020 RepID=UPI003F650813
MAKTCIDNSYEALRNQRLELNKRKFEDLGILRISKSLGELTNSEKKYQQRLPKLKSKTTVVSEPRRSSRARNPVPSYRDEIDIGITHLRKRSRSRSTSYGSYLARPIEEVKEATPRQRQRAMEAAVELQNNLKSENPSFVKTMVRSHVYSCFWLGLPSKFCEDHLPKTLFDMVLEDESGVEYEAKYIGVRTGLSGGWRAFALEHKLDDGDALVFELIEPARFKIYIIKAFPLSIQEKIEDTVDKEEISATKRKSKASTKLDLQPIQTRKSKKAMVHASDDLASPQKLQPDSETDSGDKSRDENPTKKNESVSQNFQKKGQSVDSSELKKVKIDENSNGCALQKRRKKPAPKLLRRKAY